MELVKQFNNIIRSTCGEFTQSYYDGYNGMTEQQKQEISKKLLPQYKLVISAINEYNKQLGENFNR